MRREKPCEKKERIEKFLRDKLAALALLRERDYYKFRERITENNKQELAKHMGMPVSTFGRLVNGSSTLKCLCYAVTDEEGFKGYLRLRSKII